MKPKLLVPFGKWKKRLAATLKRCPSKATEAGNIKPNSGNIKPIYNFPRGTIIPNETPEDCAVREVAG